MKRLLLVLIATIAAWLGVFATGASAVDVQVPTVQTYAYNHARPAMLAITIERGPPAQRQIDTSDRLRPLGLSGRSDQQSLPLAYEYDGASHSVRRKGANRVVEARDTGTAARRAVVERSAVAADTGTELVQRGMSEAELQETRDTSLVRGGRDGTHYVSDNVNTNALRARQRLALPQTPEVRVTLEVPRGAFSPPKVVDPAFNMPGGGMERMGTGPIVCRVVSAQPFC